MVCLLTSRFDDPESGGLNTANGFLDELRERIPENCRALFVCSDPDSPAVTDMYAGIIRGWFEDAGFSFRKYSVLDGRNGEEAAELVRGSDLIMLGGGHVPTQNRFFRNIGLREIMREYDGIVLGLSAGSMNCADTVYAQPEEPGEAADPGYERFLTGLGLTEVMLLPHYREVKDSMLDGMRLFEDITYPDSIGRTFYAIPDGSYLLSDDGREEIRGEAYRIRDGIITRIASDGDVTALREGG